MSVMKFIDNEDAIYDSMPNELQNKRTEVEVNDEEPTITRYRRVYKYGKQVSNGRKQGRKKRERPAKGRSVTIREGDTLSEIAKRNNTTVTKLKRLNGIQGSGIRAGKQLKVK